MGFRDALTSATDVDTTGPLSGAGARLYEATDANGLPYGVLEFSDGVFGDTPARLIGRATFNPRSVAGTQGGGAYLLGGSYNGVTAPELDLTVEDISAGAGNWQPVARITAPLTTPPPRVNTPLTVAPGWTQTTPLGAYIDATGYVCLNGIFANNAAFTPAGNTVFTAALPPALRPVSNKFFTITPHTSAVVVHCSIRTDGTFVLDTASGQVPAGSFFDLGPLRFHPTA